MTDAAIHLFPCIDAMDAAPALRVGERTLDFAAVGTACALFRRALAEIGVSPRDRVAVWAHPDLDSILGLVGSIAAGVTTVPLNPQLGPRELEHILADARPKVVFSAHPQRDRARTPGVPVHGFLSANRSLVTHRLADERRPDDPLLVVYTSGTTGAPKGALLSARNIAATLDGLQEAWAISPRDTIVHALPLFHVHGLVFGLFGALRAGACLHYVPRFSPESLAEALRGESRVLYAVPTMYHRLIEAAEQSAAVRESLASARLLVSGSAALPARDHARIEALTGQRVCERYGMSETFINTAVRHDRPRRAGYVGEPLPGVELRLVDEQRNPIDARDDATIGEIVVRGPNVFLGYLNRPEATLEVLDADGWFYTGDLGTLSADGYLRIVGRKATDLIKTGGFKVGAGEVESALPEHPRAREAAVIRVPDPDLGERIVAFVVAQPEVGTPSEAELIEHVAALLAPHKRPRDVRFVAQLPRNALGKVQKKKLSAAEDDAGAP